MINFKVSDMNAVYKDDREMSLAEYMRNLEREDFDRSISHKIKYFSLCRRCLQYKQRI